MVRETLQNALNNIDDRWGAKITPYIAAIRTDIAKALQQFLRARYALPTRELVEWLRREIAGRSAIEIGSGNGDKRPSLVEGYARAMEQGEWRLTPEPIAFCDPFFDDETKTQHEETLIEGQHRLEAVVKSGKTVPFTVWRHCDPEEFEVIGQGRPRRQGDVLQITRRGLKHPKMVASVVSSFLRYGLSFNGAVDSWMVRRILHRIEPDVVAVVGYKLRLKSLANSPLLSTLLTARLIDPEATDALVTSVIMNNAKPGFPARTLRDYLFKYVIDRPRDTVDTFHYKVCVAVAAHVRGQATLTKLPLDIEGITYLRERGRGALSPLLQDIYGRAPFGYYTPKLSEKLLAAK